MFTVYVLKDPAVSEKLEVDNVAEPSATEMSNVVACA